MSVGDGRVRPRERRLLYHPLPRRGAQVRGRGRGESWSTALRLSSLIRISPPPLRAYGHPSLAVIQLILLLNSTDVREPAVRKYGLDHPRVCCTVYVRRRQRHPAHFVQVSQAQGLSVVPALARIYSPTRSLRPFTSSE